VFSGRRQMCPNNEWRLSATALQLSIEAYTGTPPAADWKRPPGRPRINWLQQLEEDTGLSVGAAWIAGQDRSMWRTLRPSAGQAQQWVSEYYVCPMYRANQSLSQLSPSGKKRISFKCGWSKSWLVHFAKLLISFLPCFCYCRPDY